MNQKILLNIIPFTHPLAEATFPFYTTKKDDTFCPIHKDDIKGAWEGIIDESEFHYGDWLYTDFGVPQDDAIELSVDLIKCKGLGLHYYRHLIFSYFIGKADMMRHNFTKEIEVWMHNTEGTNPKYNVYNQFTLKVQQARISDGPELVLSYDGTTKVYSQSLAEMAGFDTNKLNWINCNGELYKFSEMPPHYKHDLDKLFPVLSNTLKPELGIAFDIPDFNNRYPVFFTALTDFYNTWLNTDEFKAVLPLSDNGFFKVDDASVNRINLSSNELQFGKGIGTDAKADFKNHGPFKPVPPPNNVRFFFIYHKPDRNGAVEALYKCFLEGFKGQFSFPNMQTYIKQPFHIEKGDSIVFDNLNEAVEVVRKAIRNKAKLPDTRYMAIFINPILKTEPDPVYHALKEMLLNEGIMLQVVRRENIMKWVEGKEILNPSFNVFLPNLEIAMLAKLGGVPWRLNRPSTNELIVGVGAFYSVSRKTRFIGSAFCFNNEGIFKGFDCFGAADTISLAGSIREAVGKFIASNYTATRLIIHFYKDIGKKELEPIMKTLKALGLPIPVIVLTINKTASKELLGFDLNSEMLMPYSGTYIKIAKNEYLLFNNTRYDEKSIPKKKEYHFPVKISISSNDKEMLEKREVVEQLIDQVYQFSRMYWKSTDQQNLPVTIKYPEMVAQIYPHFQDEKLPEFGQNTLWFL